MSADTPQELDALLARLAARYKGPQPYIGPGTPLVERVMLVAQLLGAEDPYLAVMYPEMLDRVLTNTMPEWVQPTGMGLIEIEGTPPK